MSVEIKPLEKIPDSNGLISNTIRVRKTKIKFNVKKAVTPINKLQDESIEEISDCSSFS